MVIIALGRQKRVAKLNSVDGRPMPQEARQWPHLSHKTKPRVSDGSASIGWDLRAPIRFDFQVPLPCKRHPNRATFLVIPRKILLTSMIYKIRTKSAKSIGSESTGPRSAILAVVRGGSQSTGLPQKPMKPLVFPRLSPSGERDSRKC